MNESCSNCSAAIFPDKNGSKGACRAHPPTATVVVLPQGTVQMQLVPVPIFVISQIDRDGWCREWQPAGPQIIRN
jgi:hypothetical protein